MATLAKLRKGEFAETFAVELAALVTAVKETGKPGTINVALKVAMATKGDDTTVTVTDAISVKAPNPERGSTLMFITGDGHLSRRDPRQMDIDDVRVVHDQTTISKEA